jgi:hypothetical protein
VTFAVTSPLHSHSRPYQFVDEDAYERPPISPPDSPQSNQHNSENVSPVESEIQNPFRVTTTSNPTTRKAVASNIPIARKAAPVTITPQRAYKRDISKPTKWDKYSGEPTTSDRGIPHKVQPGTVVETLEQIKLRSVTDPTTKSSQKGDSNEKPPWKGASGRTALVPAVKDTIIPGHQTPTAIVQPIPRRGLNNPSPILTSPLYQDRDSLLASSLATHVEETETEPSQTANNQSTTTSPLISSSHSQPGKQKSSVIASPISEIPEDPTSEGIQPNTAQTTVVRSNTGKSQDQRPISSFNPDNSSKSRFSWTTQATNTTYQHSPPSSPAPPVPAMPASHAAKNKAVEEHDDSKSPGSSPKMPTISIMNRTRPLGVVDTSIPPSPASPTNSIARKPIGSGPASPLNDSDGRTYISRKSSYLGIAGGIVSGKALPPTPQEIESHDHISSLQAQVDDLATQRHNVERVIKDLTAPGASNPLQTNFRVEREREKRILALKNELNEIALQEYKIGLKLHRSQKKKEEEEGYEGFSTLWVRRVTS